MTKRFHRAGLGLFLTLAIAGYAGHSATAAAGAAPGGERFEVSSIKAARPTLVDTISALKQGDAASAKKAFESYDSAWNGIEVYINTRSKDMYDTLEHNYQARITKTLEGPNPDVMAALSDAQMMLAKYDEAIAFVANAAPLNPLYDDVARLRIARAPLREVAPALKVGDVAKARQSVKMFEGRWNSVANLVKARSPDAYVAIGKGTVQIEQALGPDKPDTGQATVFVTEVTRQYNAILADVAKDARSHQ